MVEFKPTAALRARNLNSSGTVANGLDSAAPSAAAPAPLKRVWGGRSFTPRRRCELLMGERLRDAREVPEVSLKRASREIHR